MSKQTRRDALKTLGLAAFAAAAPAAASAATAPAAPAPGGAFTVPPGYKPAGSMTTLQELSLYVSRAAKPGPGGVLLLPTIAGINAPMRKFADDFAKAGMTAVVWDPYNGQAPANMPVPESLRRSGALQDQVVLKDLRRCVDYMAGDLHLTAVANIGWCLGGRFVFLQAADDARIKAVAAYNPSIYQEAPYTYGGQPIQRSDFKGQTVNEYVEAAKITCPVQVARPGKDMLMLPSEYEKLYAVLSKRSAPTLFEVYPLAEHGFHYTQEKPDNYAAAKIAWPSTVSLFRSAMGMA